MPGHEKRVGKVFICGELLQDMVTNPSEYLRLLAAHSGLVIERYSSSRMFAALFLSIIEAEPTLAGMNQFLARIRQSTGSPTILPVDLESSGERSPASDRDLIPAGDWPENVTALRKQVTIWRAVKTRQPEALKDHIQWFSDRETGVRIREPDPAGTTTRAEGRKKKRQSEETIASTACRPNLMHLLTPGDPILPALFHLQGAINRRVADKVETRVFWDAQRRAMVRHLVPTSFFAGIWLQFGEAVLEDKEFDRCKQCSNWFETSLPAARKTRQFCSDSCKTRDYMDRKRRAQELKGRGKTIKQIAEELGSDDEIVKGWFLPETKARKTR